MNNKSEDSTINGLYWSTFMESLKTVITNRQLTNDNCHMTSNNLHLTTDNSQKLLTDKQVESILELAKDLIDPQFREWHISRLYKLGGTEYLNRYDRAKKYGKNKPKYFSAILKRS